ncbi:MAG: tRNA (adenosine(37)-N6)-dimethylallyltransferase MiaA [Ruminococcus sp.]|nr:tRNA (adenosine(37)-N6)-dimethylallyltransferase MiaA [Ruminococcus sp.]
MKKIPIIVVAGPTASGKTAVAIELAKIYGGEVVSADSMQIYKGMDIATAKPTADEMQGIPHHLISAIDSAESFSVARYLDMARECISDIHSRGKLPIIAGGTGLYISSLVDNVEFDDTGADSSVRERLSAEAVEYGNQYLLDKLTEVDPDTAKTLHPNNLTRIIRALEVFELTGQKLSDMKIKSRENESPYDACMIGLNFNDRQDLYDRINLRVDIMLKNGMLEEAENTYNSANKLKTAHQAIGYKELIPYFEGEATLDECIEKIKLESRRYAKRQLTWFRRDERINWIMLDKNPDVENIITNCKKIIAKQLEM